MALSLEDNLPPIADPSGSSSISQGDGSSMMITMATDGKRFLSLSQTIVIPSLTLRAINVRWKVQQWQWLNRILEFSVQKPSGIEF